MRHQYFSALLLASIFSAGMAHAQTSAYAKFDAEGATVGLYNLLADTTGCEASRVFSGRITKFTYDANGSAHTYTFTLSSGGKLLRLNLIFNDDKILPPDAADIIEDAVERKRRMRVSARQCGSAAIWTVEEIRRL